MPFHLCSHLQWPVIPRWQEYFRIFSHEVPWVWCVYCCVLNAYVMRCNRWKQLGKTFVRFVWYVKTHCLLCIIMNTQNIIFKFFSCRVGALSTIQLRRRQFYPLSDNLFPRRIRPPLGQILWSYVVVQLFSPLFSLYDKSGKNNPKADQPLFRAIKS